MALKDDLEKEVKAIFNSQWSVRNGTTVPTEQNITLGTDAVRIDATVLYADLSDSTQLVDGHQDWFAAEVYKTFLVCAAKIIRSEGGEIVGYDGDRVMAVYIGGSKNTAAVRTGLKINWARLNIIAPTLKAKRPNLAYTVKHTVGIDTSKLFVAKAGVRGANDLVWIGRAANHAAKLCALSHDYPTWISKDVYDQMNEETRVTKGVNMWKVWNWTAMGNRQIYSSTWHWSL